MKIRIYDRKHAFADDVYVGSTAGTNFHVVPGTADAVLKKVSGQINRDLGRKCKVVEGPAAKEALAPLEEFPAEVLALMGPEGDRTPGVMDWAEKHLSDAQYLRRYRVAKRMEMDAAAEKAAAEKAAAEKAAAEKAAAEKAAAEKAAAEKGGTSNNSGGSLL